MSLATTLSDCPWLRVRVLAEGGTEFRRPESLSSMPLVSKPMATPQRVHITHEFTSDPQTVFDKLAEHENLGPVFGANITRVSDGATSRNGAGSVRRLKLGPLPAFEETTTTAQPNTLIEYKITKGSPLKGHWGRQELTPTPSGGTRLDYTIGFDSAIPGLAAIVGKVLASAISKGLPKLTD